MLLLVEAVPCVLERNASAHAPLSAVVAHCNVSGLEPFTARCDARDTHAQQCAAWDPSAEEPAAATRALCQRLCLDC